MWRRTGFVCALLLSLPAVAAAKGKLVVHEWGTFTAVAGSDGAALEWRPLQTKSDLPAFVFSVERPGGGLRGHLQTKGSQNGTVRMETPVVYFYSEEPRVVSLKVRFPAGQVTEWYPQARSVDAEGVDWGQFLVAPTGDDRGPLPGNGKGSHYYAARATDSALLRVCGEKDMQYEKFLFYRGVGTFALPLQVKLEQDGARLRMTGPAAGKLVVFERHGSSVRWTVADKGDDDLTVTRAALVAAPVERLHDALETVLAGQGLYAKEAAAMVDTWKDQWFEDGLRVFFILPRASTDAVLPMIISPAPDSLVRVLVGRVEVITPELERAVADIAAAEPGQAAMELTMKWGRFARPILDRAISDEKDAERKSRLLLVRAGL